MIKSMTGFGRCQKDTGEYRLFVEVKAVNHKYCEIVVKLPKKLSLFETKIRNILKEYAERGKIDIFLSYESFTGKNECIQYNKKLAREYMECIEDMSEEFGIENDMKASMLARLPDVLVLEDQELDEKELWDFLEPVLREAFVQFVQVREAEGKRLQKDILNKLESMEQVVQAIIARSPEIVSEYREKLQEKVAELLGDANKVDPTMLATEIVIFADKICVDEETVRLLSHITSMKDTLQKDSNTGIGRRLDFIAQEMNREANTILSKANDMEITDYAIHLKTEIEKIREQIQNIE